jgi:hypothetical protein
MKKIMGGKNWELTIVTRRVFPPRVRSRVRPYAAGMERPRLSPVTAADTVRLFFTEARKRGSWRTA